MRVRALLFVSMLAVVVLGVGASSAPAATLWLSTAHTSRVTVGATVTATAETNIDLTQQTNPGAVVNRCTTGSLHAILEENSDIRVSLRVVAGSFPNCHPLPVTTTHSPPWTLTIFGNGTANTPAAGTTAYHATIDTAQFHVGSFFFHGNIENITATQPTVAASPITIRTGGSCGPFNSVLGIGCIDGNFRLDGAAAGWSLTN